MGLSVSKSAGFKTAEKIFFALIASTGFWTILAAQSWVYENPIKSGSLFAIAFLHVLLAAWYCCFVSHKSRRLAFVIGLIAIFSFGHMCFEEYSSNAAKNEWRGPREGIGRIWPD